jgi:hypothetical protein
MGNKDDENNKEKHDYGKEINGLFDESIADRDKAYAHYMDAHRQICLRVSKKLGKIITHDNFDSMMNGGFTQLIDIDLYRDVLKKLDRRLEDMERELYDFKDGHLS